MQVSHQLMNYVRYEHIVSDTYNIPDGEIFTVYKKENQHWAFGMRIGKRFTLTRFQDQKVDIDGIRKTKKQILFCKKYGWSYTGAKSVNPEVDEPEPEFMCMYCDTRTFDTSRPCGCRGIQLEDMFKKTESGIILPF